MEPKERHIYHSFLLKQLHEFYAEVIRQKEQAQLYREGRPPSDTAREIQTDAEATFKEAITEAGVSADDLSEQQPTHPIFIRLLDILERQVAEARRHGGEYGVTFYKEAQYAMAALADECFLHKDWRGKREWIENLLEFKLFGTYVAGERIFSEVETLLKRRDPAYVEMAAVYFLVLSLGFRGKYRDQDDEGRIENYRRQLFAFIFQKNPDVNEPTRLLFPEAYTHTLTTGGGEQLPYLKWWLILIGAVLLTTLIVSHGLWVYLTDDLTRIVDAILLRIRTL